MDNPLNEKQLQDLRRSVTESYRALAPFRRNRIESIKEHVGKHYSDDGAGHEVPLPYMALAADTYHWTLSSRVPQVMITPRRNFALRPQSERMEQALNHLFQHEINAYWSFSRATRNAIFGMGMMKCGTVPKYQVEIEGFQHDIGQFFADPVSIDDWVHDRRAKTYEQVTFAGNFYELPYQLVMEDPYFTNKDGLKPTSRFDTNELDGGERKAQEISRGDSWTPDAGEWMPMVKLLDLWLPMTGREPLFITIPVAEGKPLHVEEWTGPERGPYHLLGFGDVPDQIMPLPPAALWMDMHKFANALFRKAKQQALRQKTVTVYRGSAADDAAREQKASDGTMLLADDPDGIRELVRGGADPRTIALIIQSRDLFSWLAGNLDTLAGLSPQADTAAQENLLNTNAGKRFEQMQYSVYVFQHDVMKDGAWYTYNEPLIEYPTIHRVPGTDIAIPQAWTPDDREADFIEHEFSIDPNSLVFQTPGGKLRRLTEVWERFVIPMMPQLEARGITPKVETLLKLIAKYSNLPEIEEILDFGQPPMEAGGGSHERTMAPNTTRTNVRINRPGGTRSGRDAAMMQTLMGAGVQNAQMDAMMTGNNR